MTVLASPLQEQHLAEGAKMADFAGWSMPLEFTGAVSEHRAVRDGVGMFDVSHLGTLRVRGVMALDRLNEVFSNDLDRIRDGEAQYTLLLNDAGGVVDDLILYRVSDEEAILIPNAANTASVAEVVTAAGLQVSDESRSTAIIAVQGPDSDVLVDDLELPALDFMQFAHANLLGVPVVVCRTGYTGERGVELLVPAARAGEIWRHLADSGVTKCGLAARDTLRTEMGYPLHGRELRPEVPALWCSVGWAIARTKRTFAGKAALAELDVSWRILGVRLSERGVPRPDMEVLRGDRAVGITTSGTFSPTLSCGIALARLERPVEPGDAVVVDVRGRRLAAEIVRPPFVPSHVRG